MYEAPNGANKLQYPQFASLFCCTVGPKWTAASRYTSNIFTTVPIVRRKLIQLKNFGQAYEKSGIFSNVKCIEFESHKELYHEPLSFKNRDIEVPISNPATNIIFDDYLLDLCIIRCFDIKIWSGFIVNPFFEKTALVIFAFSAFK